MKFSQLLASAVLVSGLAAQSASAVEWDGAYAGVLTGTYNIFGGGTASFSAVRLGYNLQNADLVYGGEVVFGRFPTFGINYWWLNGRVGYAVADTFMVYGVIGRGGSNVPTNSWQYGLGGEVMVSQNASVRIEATQVNRIGTGVVGNTFSLGIGWNF